jgi:hypothetical protein
MKFIAAATAALCLAPVFAAPTKTFNKLPNIVARNVTGESSTTTLATATTTAEVFSVTQTLYPDVQVRWSSKTPDVQGKHNVRGHLLNSEWEQVSTAVHFSMPASAAGKSCRLVFRMTADDALVGTPDFDVYKLQGCLNDDYTYANRVPREMAVGHLTAVKGRASEWASVDMSGEVAEPLMGSAPNFPCRAGAEYSFEMAARRGGNIGWTSPRGGLSIEICG